MSPLSKVVLFAAAASLISAPMTEVYGSQNLRTGTSHFVDLDGDGFDDGLPDDDNNGIPDQLESGRSGKAQNGAAQPRGAVISLDRLSQGLVAQTNSQRFSLREFRTRAQSTNRCNFDFWFGGAEGLGAAAASGGLCAGGVCIPR